MWYPEWFGSFENWMLSATFGITLSCFLVLVRINEALRDIKKELRDGSERRGKEFEGGAGEDER